MYGAPPNIGVLRAFLQEQESQEAWRMYMADMTCSVFKALRPKARMPYYSELVSKKHQDSRSSQEIIDGVKKELLKRKAAWEVKKKYEAI
jgi:hypothetical protein